jgi:hypothetical protein
VALVRSGFIVKSCTLKKVMGSQAHSFDLRDSEVLVLVSVVGSLYLIMQRRLLIL